MGQKVVEVEQPSCPIFPRTFGTVFLGVKGEGHEVRLLEKGGVQLDWLVK